MVSFKILVNKIYTFIQKPDPPYAIPTVSEPIHEYMDLMPVPLPDQLAGKLSSGASVNLPLWIRGQAGSGNSGSQVFASRGMFEIYVI